MENQSTFKAPRKNYTAEEKAAIAFFEEYPGLHNHLDITEFIEGLNEPVINFFHIMLNQGMSAQEVHELAIKQFVIEPLYALVETYNIPMNDD